MPSRFGDRVAQCVPVLPPEGLQMTDRTERRRGIRVRRSYIQKERAGTAIKVGIGLYEGGSAAKSPRFRDLVSDRVPEEASVLGAGRGPPAIQALQHGLFARPNGRQLCRICSQAPRRRAGVSSAHRGRQIVNIRRETSVPCGDGAQGGLLRLQLGEDRGIVPRSTTGENNAERDDRSTEVRKLGAAAQHGIAYHAIQFPGGRHDRRGAGGPARG